MSTPAPGPGGEGAEPGPVRSVVRLFLTQLLAVIGIAAVITVVVAFVGPDRSDVQTASSPDRSSTEPSETSAATSPAPTTTPSPSSPAGTPSPTSSPRATSSDTEPAPVDVLNQSAEEGSAGETAERLEEAGWEIGRVDDFRGNVSTTTVYWLEADHRRQARQISRFLGGVRVQEGFDTLKDGRVSVILVD